MPLSIPVTRSGGWHGFHSAMWQGHRPDRNGDLVRYTIGLRHKTESPLPSLRERAQTRLILVMLADVAREGVEAFQRYEAAVLPRLERHNGRLERRLRTADGQAEVHIVSFRSRSAYEAYIADPERADHRALLEGVALTQRLLEVTDVGATAPVPTGGT
ncbi:hypothetical protein SAMN05661080_04872 [Modestobacter sp. DSM 44400]|nr:hypothetical protein SAMN05661080_04872 [Modestobacter sp. DSM 44400]